MKRNISILIFILSLGSYSVRAQNFVPNGNFEILDTCPTNQAQITYAVGWLNAGGTPDYYNSCAPLISNFNVPNMGLYYQKDCCGGLAYSGIYVWSNNHNNSGREYITIKLSNTLNIGKKYLSSMYVNRCSALGYAIATIGMLFNNTLITSGGSSSGNLINGNPQVTNKTFLKDTISWILVQDTFIAVGNETYLTIGNFSNDSLSDTLKIASNGAYYFESYYYLDDVSVYEIDGSCNSYWDAGFDRYISVGDSVQLGAINTDSSNYIWQNSIGGITNLSSNTDARPWSKPTQTTTYYVNKTCTNNNIFTDTLTVYVYEKPSVNIGKDSVYCGIPSLPIILDAGSGQGYIYHWSTGATTQTISISNSGTYSVNVSSPTSNNPITAPYSSSFDSITLSFYDLNDPGILHDTDLCNSSQFPIILDASVPVVPGTNNTYTWVGGHFGPQLTVNSPGTYIVTVWVRDGSNALICKVKDTSIVNVGCVGIKQFTNNNAQINLYPNPNNGTMMLDYNVKADANLEISDLSGRLVGTYFLPAAGTHAEVKNNELNNGVYIYRVTSNGVVIKIGKIIVMQ